MSDIQHRGPTRDDRRSVAGTPSPGGSPPAAGAGTAGAGADRSSAGTDVSGFTAVDTAADPRALVAWMDTARTLPGLRIAKSLAVQALALRRVTTQRVVDELAATVADGWAGRGLRRLFTAAGAPVR